MSNKYRVEKDEYDITHHWDVSDKHGNWKGCFPTRRLARIWALFLNTISWIDRKGKK